MILKPTVDCTRDELIECIDCLAATMAAMHFYGPKIAGISPRMFQSRILQGISGMAPDYKAKVAFGLKVLSEAENEATLEN